MSEVYASYVGAQASRIPLKDTLIGYDQLEHEPWYPRGYTTWTPELKEEMLHFFEKCNYPYRSYEEIPFKDPLRSEIRRFFISLDAYMESPHPVIPEKDLLYGATDIEFAEYLKRVKRKSFETTWHVENFEYPDWWNDVPAYRIHDIGDIFNYSYLPFFKMEVDDYLYGDLDLTYKEDWIATFKSTLLRMLPDREDFQKIEPIEVLSQISSSISMERGSFQHKPHYMLKNKYLYFSKKRGICDRSVIQVSPNNCRDSVINDPSDLNTISLIDQQTMEILRCFTGHIHLRNKEIVSARYKSFYNKYSQFLHRDIRKEGITKPRVLLKVMLEALHEKYPDIEIYQYTSFYDEYQLRVNGVVTFPKRGHGLGMANALTTLMQLVIHELITDELEVDIPSLDCDCLTINDDFVAGFNDEYHLESYWEKEDEVMSFLGILRQPDKSFRSHMSYVLAERYITQLGEYEKISYQLRELLLPLACANVTHAKEYFIAAQSYVNHNLVPQYLNEILSYWGYEFYPTEFNYPSKVGGWINEHIEGVDTTFLQLDELPLKSYVFRGFQAAKRKLYRKKSERMYTPPLLSLISNLKIPEEFSDNFDILPLSQIHDKYGRKHSLSQYNFKKYWENLKKVRQKEFKKPCNLTYEELLHNIQEYYETTQFYPSDVMIYQYHPCDYHTGQVDEIYLDQNAKMACLSKFNSTDYPFKETFSIRFSNTDNHLKKLSEISSKEVRRTLESQAYSVLNTGRSDEFYYPKGDYHPEEQYLNPIKIGIVIAKINWGRGYPELKPNYEHPLIREKKSVFNRLFTLTELIKISRSSLSRSEIKYIADILNTYERWTFDDVIEFYLELRSHQKISTPEPIETEPEVEDNKITVTRLIDGDDYLFWSWRQNPQDYSLGSEEVDECFNVLDLIVNSITFQGGALRAEAERYKNKVLSGEYGQLPILIGTRQGVWKLFDEDQLNEALDAVDGFGDLFEEG